MTDCHMSTGSSFSSESVPDSIFLQGPPNNLVWGESTVKRPNRGHFGDGPFVPCREVVLFSEVLL